MNETRRLAWLTVKNTLNILLVNTKTPMVIALIRAAIKVLDEAEHAELKIAAMEDMMQTGHDGRNPK